MPKEKTVKRDLTLRMSEDLYSELEAISKELGVPKSTIGVLAISNFIRDFRMNSAGRKE